MAVGFVGHLGFTNYATAGVAMTLETDRVHHDRVIEVVRIERAHCRRGVHSNIPDIWDEPAALLFEVSDQIKSYVETAVEQVGGLPPLAAQLVQAGLVEVDWEDLARHFLIVESETAASVNDDNGIVAAAIELVRKRREAR